MLQLTSFDGLEPLDGKKHPGLERTTGHVGFMGHGGRVEFRKIRIRKLATAVTAE